MKLISETTAMVLVIALLVFMVGVYVWAFLSVQEGKKTKEMALNCYSIEEVGGEDRPTDWKSIGAVVGGATLVIVLAFGGLIWYCANHMEAETHV